MNFYAYLILGVLYWFLLNTLFSHTHCPIYTLIYTLSLTKSGYLEGLPDLSELHRVVIHGIRQISFVAVVTWSVFICSLTDLRGCLCSGVVGAPRLTRFLPLVLVVAIGGCIGGCYWCESCHWSCRLCYRLHENGSLGVKVPSVVIAVKPSVVIWRSY